MPSRAALRGVSRAVCARGPALLLLALLASAASANPVPGFRENFNGTSLGGWSGGSVISNPGTGGLTGDGDGFLMVSVPGPTPGNLGTMSNAAAYTGDWTAAGITTVRFWLNDVGTADALEIHFALGDGLTGNFWQCNTGFIPPHGSWAPFTVDLTNAANFTLIGGTLSPSFAGALQTVDRVLIRHDLAPYVKQPDQIVGDFGIDAVLLSNGTTGVGPAPGPVAGEPVRLAPPWPNPSRGAVTLRLRSADDSPVRIEVVDALGRLVRHAVLAGVAGERTWSWDGRDDRGAPLAPGAYRARAYGAAGGTSQPLVRL